jgi:uncharacterized Zn-binding protein involved in type VI secretion
MPGMPAARVGDVTAHGSPLIPGPGSMNVMIGGQPAWRGMSAAAIAALAAAATQGAEDIAKATATNAAAAGTPGAPAAAADLAKTVADTVAKMASLMASSGADIHACPIVKVLVPDGPGVDITPSQTVMINGLPAGRMGDTIQEATSVNAIAMGLPTVMIGG